MPSSARSAVVIIVAPLLLSAVTTIGLRLPLIHRISASERR
ncbi:hypothetical protein [Rhodococcus sp. IEGM 1374]|nr:hypothetical protein [Rhodococcus sp. IEGM 1374]MDV7991647.1 hypothetical protein [Rhodococcus sp. IEGM 1374]